MDQSFTLPLAMLAISVAFRTDGTATLSGLWYFKSSKLPPPGDDRKGIGADLTAHECAMVDLTGTQRQIAELLMLAVAAETEGESTEAIARMRSLLVDLTSSPRAHHDFDGIHNPRGTSLPIDFPVRVDTDFTALKQKLFAHPDHIRLRLQAGWSLWNEIQSSQ